MDRLKTLLRQNEEWLKKHILEFSGQDTVPADWPAFFSSLIASMPTSTEDRFVESFDKVGLPALLLDDELNVMSLNGPASDLLGGTVPFSLASVAPWLSEAVERECSKGLKCSVIRFEVSHVINDREKHFHVTVSDEGSETGGRFLVLDDVTFQAEIQRQLIRERNRASHYLDVVGSMVVVLDASCAVTMVNQMGCEMLGYERHELLGRDWVETVVPVEQRDEVRDYLCLVLSQEADVDGEQVNYVVTKDGEERLVQWQNKLLSNEGGTPIGILASGVDITDQHAVEDALSEKELWLRATFVALGEAVFILTPDRRILDANPAAEGMFQMTNKEILKTPVEDFHVDAIHYAEFLTRCREAFENGEKALFEFPMRRGNGEIFPSEHSVSLILDDEGQELGVVSGMRDISARKQAEEILRQSEEKFRRIFESIEEGYIVTNLEGEIQMVNPATCRILGYEESELVGQGIEMLYADPEDRGALRRAVNSGEAVRGMTLKARCKDGHTISVDTNSHFVLGSAGQPIGMEGTFRDITHRIEAEKVLREREQQYRAFFENNHAVMLLTDPKTEQIVDANPAASEFYGYPQDDLRAMNMNRINKLSQGEMFAEMQLAREEKRAYFILQHILADSSLRDVEVYSGSIMVQGRQLLYSVIHDVTKRIRLEHEMLELATTDALTGVANRHQFFAVGTRELRRAMRYKKPLTVLMIDIDYFKSINDSYGHQAGDVVLKQLAQSATTMLRETDTFGRLGGEEFAVVLPETGLKLGMEVAERLRKRLAALKVESDETEISFTVSIGATLARRSDKIIEDVIKRADDGLYKAKRMGRNRVERG